MDKNLLAIFLALLVSTSANAEIYKWVDEHGKVHYGDKPNPKSEQLNISEESSPSKSLSKQEREERRKRLIDAYNEDRAQKKEQAEKDRKKKARLNRNCAIAKDRLKGYMRAGSLYDLDKDGNRINLSKEEREKATNSLRKQINKYCK